jgi:hypothetical protein
MAGSELYEIRDTAVQVPLGLHMVAFLTGFSDAGSTIEQVADHVFDTLDFELIAQFNNDELLDYRSRRPIMLFEKDHISDYQPPVLGLYLVTDEAGQEFLLLNGYEPDFKWEAFADSIMELAEIFAVADITWVHSIPFPIPHSRSIGVTASGNRKDLIDAVTEWKPMTQVPGNVLHLIEYRATRNDIPTIGYVLLVPHYLSDNEYPEAAIAAFQHIGAATGLVFPTDKFRDASVKFHKKLDAQIAENPELARMVQSLEQGYQNELIGPGRAPINKPAAKIPSAEEIAAELEDYLASRRKNSVEDDADNESE